jgi:porphobilinogen synthase
MLISAINNGWISENDAILESVFCIKRAGASAILTYFAPKIAKLIEENQI